MLIPLPCKDAKATVSASVVRLGVRDSRPFSCILPLSSVYGSLLMVQYGCSDPSHHIPIPANRTEEEQGGHAISLQDTSVYVPQARTQGYGHTELSGEAGKGSLYSGHPYVQLKVRNLRKRRNNYWGKLAVWRLALIRICCKVLAELNMNEKGKGEGDCVCLWDDWATESFTGPTLLHCPWVSEGHISEVCPGSSKTTCSAASYR